MYMLLKESLGACAHTLFQALYNLEPDYQQMHLVLKLLPSLSPAFQLQTRDDAPNPCDLCETKPVSPKCSGKVRETSKRKIKTSGRI